MSDELRRGLVDAVERFACDLQSGEHGDPHVGFLTLIAPDAPPKVVVIAESGVHDIEVTRLAESLEESQQDQGPRFYTFRDLADAEDALGAAESAVRVWRFRATEDTRTLGEAMVEAVEHTWQRRRDRETDALLRKADDERQRPIVCGCGRRFTARGHGTHLARNRWCPDAQAHQTTGADT